MFKIYYRPWLNEDTFLECRQGKTIVWRKFINGRLKHAEFFNNKLFLAGTTNFPDKSWRYRPYVLILDIPTGEVLWEKEIYTEAFKTSAWMIEVFHNTEDDFVISITNSYKSNYDNYILRIKEGNIEWAKRINRFWATSIHKLLPNGYFVVGSRPRPIDDYRTPLIKDEDGLFLKLNEKGELEWHLLYGAKPSYNSGIFKAFPRFVSQEPDGSIVVFIKVTIERQDNVTYRLNPQGFVIAELTPTGKVKREVTYLTQTGEIKGTIFTEEINPVALKVVDDKYILIGKYKKGEEEKTWMAALNREDGLVKWQAFYNTTLKEYMFKPFDEYSEGKPLVEIDLESGRPLHKVEFEWDHWRKLNYPTMLGEFRHCENKEHPIYASYIPDRLKFEDADNVKLKDFSFPLVVDTGLTLVDLSELKP